MDIVDGETFNCVICNNKFYGLASKQENTEKSIVYDDCKEGKSRTRVVCNKDSCITEIEESIGDCAWCKIELGDLNETEISNMTEDDTINWVMVLCSRKCRLEFHAFLEQRIKEGGSVTQVCSICKNDSKDMFRCEHCQIKFYCSKECQTSHEKECPGI